MLVEEDGWTAGRPARYISYAVAARRRGELLLAIYARHVASHHTSNGINLHRAPSTAPATRRAVLEVSLSLSLSLRPGERQREAPPIFHPFENRRIGKN